MSTEGSFYITLPSNTKQFESNKLNSYRVRLPQRIDLEGSGWELALVEAICPHSWFNFTSEDVKKNQLVVYVAIPFKNFSGEEERFIQHINIHVAPNYYETVTELVNTINDDIMAKMSSAYKVKTRKGTETYLSMPKFLNFDHDTYSNRVHLNIENDEIVQKIHMAPKLAYVLGFDQTNFTIMDKGWELSKSDKITRRADYPPDMKAGLYALYVYCDIVENQIVGDVLVPLLAKVPITGTHDTVIHTVFNPPMYLPLVKHEIETIEVELKDDANQSILFQYGRVVLTLHFRRRLSFL